MRNIPLKQIIYVVFILFLGYSFLGSVRLLLKAKANLSDAQVQLEQKTRESVELHNKLVEEEKGIYVERVARDTLGLARPEEVVLVLPPESALQELSPRKARSKVDANPIVLTPHWQEWLKLFI